MSLLRNPAHAIHAAFNGGAAVRLVKRESLKMVLQQDRAMRKELRQHIAEFVEFEFVGVKWIRSGSAA